MNTAREIRIATGIKKIELGNENMAMLQISDVLKQHRETLINSMLSGLSTYVQYHFSTPPSRDHLERIRHKLLDLKNSSVSLTRYSSIIGEVLENEHTYIKSELFYQEINEVISDELNPSQLTISPSL